MAKCMELEELMHHVICRWGRVLIFHLTIPQVLKTSHLCRCFLKLGTKVEVVQREPFPFAELGGKNYWELLPSSTLEGKAHRLLLLWTQQMTKVIPLSLMSILSTQPLGKSILVDIFVFVFVFLFLFWAIDFI